MVLDEILCCFFLAGLAETNELKQVAIYSESSLPGEALLRLCQITVSKVNNPAAVGANQVVMVPRGTNCVAVAVTSGMQLADKP